MPLEKLNKKTWMLLRPALKNSYAYNSTWDKVISLFKKRIDNFYFDPIDIILKPNSRKGEGFAVVTLQCALIETFAAFKLGKIYNHDCRSNKQAPSYEYWSSGKFFEAFLLAEDIFKDHFFSININGVRKNNYPYNAKEFYERVRCALMHEARTKEDWRITANPQRVPKNKFIGKDKGDKVIHRTILNDKLKDYFNQYIVSLKAQNSDGNELRRLLGRKLDHLHSLQKDMSYDWWGDW